MYKCGTRSSSSSKTRKGLTLVVHARKKKKIQYLDVNTFRASRPGRKADMRPKKKRVKKKK